MTGFISNKIKKGISPANDNDEVASTINLTKREQECLNWCAVGKTNEEIGLILQISRRTVDHYMENMKRKLDCVNKVSLIRRAIQFKLIEN